MTEPLYSRDDLLAWAAGPEETLFAEAERLTRTCAPRLFDRCSIVNGKGGRCPEDCKWCAQSAHHRASCDIHGLISPEECLRHARANEAAGIRRFSIVNSGRRPTPTELDGVCDLVRLLRRETSLELCASLGLLDEPALCRLFEAGVTRYHCNLESSPAFFPTLCSTHTQAEKIETLRAARRDLGVRSIPINILAPIPGTPLADLPLLPERDILRAVALFRLAHPAAYLRFAGGRKRLSPQTLDAALRLGVNAAIEGDLLTTVGNTVAQDRAHLLAAGYALPC